VKIIGSGEQNIEITVTENQVLFNNGDVCLISRLIGGQFPNYRQVIPGEYISRIRVSTRELAESTERAALLTRDGSPIIRLKISDNILVVSVNTEAGRVREEISIYQEGEPLQFAFNARYLSDALKMIGSEDVNIEFTGPLSPGILRPVSDIEYLSLLLPVRLRDE
ncbi:MAG: DNA polymerase III subunit beta, partial [Desulfotomaculaceae bacterium]